MHFKLGIFSGIRNRKKTRKSFTNRVMPSNFPVGIWLRHLVGLIISRGGLGLAYLYPRVRICYTDHAAPICRPGRSATLIIILEVPCYVAPELAPHFWIYCLIVNRINGTNFCYHFKILTLRCLLNNSIVNYTFVLNGGWYLSQGFRFKTEPWEPHSRNQWRFSLRRTDEPVLKMAR